MLTEIIQNLWATSGSSAQVAVPSTWRSYSLHYNILYCIWNTPSQSWWCTKPHYCCVPAVAPLTQAVLLLAAVHILYHWKSCTSTPASTCGLCSTRSEPRCQTLMLHIFYIYIIWHVDVRPNLLFQLPWWTCTANCIKQSLQWHIVLCENNEYTSSQFLFLLCLPLCVKGTWNVLS